MYNVFRGLVHSFPRVVAFLYKKVFTDLHNAFQSLTIDEESSGALEGSIDESVFSYTIVGDWLL